ncbi:MAG: GNAT family N-acetyltransferase [Oscillospiraceae bacterium]|nr:GNAT family N-acetyltransferase [Oscillospiraceae bacterium]
MKIYKTMENGVRIVEYDDSLAAPLADMWNKSGDSWGGDSEVRTARQIASDFAGGAYFNIFVAVDGGGEAVGLCTLDRYYKDADTAYVHVLNVRPDYHGKKVGKELVLACVERTIELGYPRVDIHTWAGNTKAVPLYKKCGFLWEDRADTTHLSNYIPTVLSTGLFADFFRGAHWYDDSTRIIEIKPDGQKYNKFELYGYSWEKDKQNLAVGFEKTGRRIRYVETDDYKIEFIAENHELAFGLNYSCTFAAENKSGKELNIKIAGKSDKGIKFDYGAEQTVYQTAEFKAGFFVEPVTEEIDIWRMHPCVLADVWINGKHAEFGLGIEPKFPLSVSFIEKRHALTKPGMTEDVYINIKSALSKTASVKFDIPKNNMTRFFSGSFEARVNPGETAMIPAKAEILDCGYEKSDIDYHITLDDEQKVNFTKPLHLVNQDTVKAFCYETDGEYCAVNGVWKLSLNKHDNFTSFYRAAGDGHARFPMPKLGKPYDDEFNLAKPLNVRMYKSGELMVLEADYESDKFKGALLTQINSFGAGVISHGHKITNKSKETVRLYLQEEFWTSVGRRSMFCCEGEIHEISDNTAYGFSDLHSGQIDENWIFDNSHSNKSGMYWDKEYKPAARWGDELSFEYDTGDLEPGGVFETRPSVYMSGIFTDVKDFRNYVLGINEETAPYFAAPLDICVNGKNPFIDTAADKIHAAIKNNRLKIYSGSIKFFSPDNLFDETVCLNPEKEITKINEFDAALKTKTPGIYLAGLDFDFQLWKKTHRRALFVTDAGSRVQTDKSGNVYTVTNGKLCFKLSPDYFSAVYSLKYGSDEWLFSKYPVYEPYAWWNPFIGGISMNIWQMNANLTIREKTTAEFVSVADSCKTKWTGIKSTVAIDEFAEHKGLSYEQYYLTLPGLPVLCYFVRFINNTGGYKHIGYDMTAYISGKENLTDIYARLTNDNREYDLRLGDAWSDGDNLVRISYENKSRREEKLYVYTDNARNNGGVGVASDINQGGVWTNANTNIAEGGASTLRPVFFILTKKELTAECLCDLDRVTF